MMKRILFVFLLALSLVGAAAFVAPEPVFAQEVTEGLQGVAETINLPSTDPRIIATNIINASLGLLGILLVGIIVYAGFLYMTSGGDEEKTNQAKRWIRNAIIGLILILSSWAIARFVIERLLDATTNGGQVTTGGGGPGFGGGFTGGGASTSFQVKSISPQGSVSIRNVVVKIVFTRPVDDDTAGAIAVLQNGGTTVGGTISVNGSLVTFTPSDTCPPPNDNLSCFDADTEYTVQVGSTLRSMSGQTIACGGFAPDCSATFTTGNLVDTQDPTVSLTEPYSGQSVPADSLVLVRATANDDSGISHVTFVDNGDTIDSDGPDVSPSPTTFDAQVEWDTAGLPLQSTRTLKAQAYDLDGNTAESSSVNVIVRPPSCFNGVQDGEETGLDCGGTPNTPGFCGACSGGSCSENSQCSSGVCSSGGTCVEQPVITAVSPQDGKPGTYVTVSGQNFGTNGQVVFLGAPGSGDDIVATVPAACQASGLDTWNATQVIIEVPTGAVSGPLQITNSASGLQDRTDDALGPGIPDFVVNDNAYPGLCAVDPNAGFTGDQFTAIGSGFGNAPDAMSFGAAALSSFSAWGDGQITTNVPIVQSGPHNILVHVGAVSSNPVAYTVQSKATAGPPTILSLNPEEGPRGEYVTLLGTSFGWNIGTVRFKNTATGEDALADTNFPAACSETYWTSTNVVVKVPQQFLNSTQVTPGAYTVRLVRSDNVESNEVPFTVVSGNAKPGICAISPTAGPVGTEVTVTGERFGSVTGNITFHDGKAAISSTWTSSEVKTEAPVGAVTGPVTITAGGQGSNGVNFTVANCNATPDICAPSDVCCANGTCASDAGACGAVALSSMFAWQSSTGLVPVSPRVVEECAPNQVPAPVPSPSPWINRAGGDQVCVTATMAMRFTTHLDPTTVTPANFNVKRCDGGGANPCDTTSDVALAAGSPFLQPASQDQDLVLLEAAGGLDPDTTYLVEVTTGVRGAGAGGAFMEERASCGSGIGYCYRYKTRASTDACTLGGVSVSPHPYELNDSGATVEYLASPIAAGDKCVVLSCSPYDWTWEHGDGNADGRAIFETPFNIDSQSGLTSCRQTGVALMETGEVPVNMNATAQPDAVKGTAHLFVRFIPPRVTDYGPGCQTACANALVWATFNTELDPMSIPGNVEVRTCANENCILTELGPPLAIPASNITLTAVPKSLDPTPRYLRIEPTVPGPNNTQTLLFAPGKFYRVLLRGGDDTGIRGLNGVPMAGLNDPEGFAWTFRVKVGEDAFCAVDSVDVAPQEKYETEVGARQLFVATPYGAPDDCRVTGQALVQNGSASWSTSDASVADFVAGGIVDTGGDLPAQCSSSCLWAGASAEFGKVAVCGNGIIETTDPVYCSGNATPYGDLCTVLPAGAKAGEQCDPGVPSNVGLCDPHTCLWKPVPQVPAGTCGNGTIEQGEACDFGRTCEGAEPGSNTPDGTDCTLGADQIACEANGGTCAPRMYRGCTQFCRHAGSASGGSTCGNLDIADGEDCDDGNLTSGDGCSAQCLHTGSSALVASVCGNAILEPGEACEKPTVNAPFPAGCDAKSCLNLGSFVCDNDPNTPDVNCCGNTTIEAGEDCDDGNKESGDGCSSACLLEGSSALYPTPSFCSNGVLEVGEQCEAATPGGDGFIDAAQLAEIIGEADPDENGLMTSVLTAELDAQQGTATYGLQCGFTDEQSCSPGYGLSDAGCCYVRPELASSYPSGSGVCRNVVIRAEFNTSMDPESIPQNAQIAKFETGPNCPAGTQLVWDDLTPRRDGILGWLGRVWDRIAAWFTGDDARAAVWCMGDVTGVWAPANGGDTTEFVFKLDTALDANTVYRVKFLGDNSTTPDPLSDNNDLTQKLGIRSSRGVVTPFDSSTESGPLTFVFTTGADVCTANLIQVTDTSFDHPLLFVDQGEQHPFTAEAISLQNGVAVPVTPVSDYSWEWQPWTTSNIDIVDVVNPLPGQTNATVEAKGENGNAFVVAWIEVTTDDVHVPSTVGTTIQGTAPVTVNLCKNPWPNLNVVPVAPFRDKAPTGNGQDSSLVGTIFENGPFFNFSTTYCRDAGGNSAADDLPKMEINYVPATTVDSEEGILRQYLFTYGDDRPDLKKDGIGIRVAANPLHFSPEDWYAWRGFGGDPKSIEVDGYRAIQDGTTTYIAAANTENPGERIYSNIYLISHNPDAEDVTVGIYDQMVQNLAFNINLTQGVANVCEVGNNPNIEPALPYYGPDGYPVRCSADYECLNIGDDYHCGSYKLKLARDTERVADFQSLSRAIETSKDQNGTYPKLTAGTFVRSFTTSKWPSWEEEFASAIQANPPEDPVNQFQTCGRCSESLTLCGTSDDCPASETCAGYTVNGGLFTPADNTEPLTCYDTAARTYVCPRIGSSPSRAYHYRSVNNGSRYELAAEFEVPEPIDPNAEWWSPPLQKEVKRCVNNDSFGFLCDVDSDCRPCANPKDFATCPESQYPTTNGSCRAVGGRFVYQDVCVNQPYGVSGTCGDGVIGSACSGGSNDGNACSVDADCPGGSCSSSEVCELGQTAYADCTTDGNQPGLKLQICNECKEFVDQVGLSSCNETQLCGNGKIDKLCNGGVRNGLGCITDVECAGDPGQNIADGMCISGGETCDDGALNGTYGNCNLQCSGYAAYCGDGMISPGELCDLGAQNGQYCGNGCDVSQSCNLSCSGKAPYCGDGQVTSPEQCDGESQVTSQGICLSGSLTGEPCNEDSECGAGGQCASGSHPLASCEGVNINKCASTLKQCVTANYTTTSHDPGSFTVCQEDTDCQGEPGGKTSCRSVQDFVSSCTSASQCSLGAIQGECLSFPTAHVRTCQTGGLDACSYSSWSSCEVVGYCGDGIIQSPAEQCDDGSENGDTKACTSTCKLNVCGDGKPYVGVEECDAGTQNGQITCQSDYNSSCASCSTQCKFLASSGGYCGDEVQSGPEQCDGNTTVATVDQTQLLLCNLNNPIPEACEYTSAVCENPPCTKTKQSGVTCEALGYDFPINGANPNVIPLNSSVDKDITTSQCADINGMKYYDYLAYYHCLGMRCLNATTFNTESLITVASSEDPNTTIAYLSGTDGLVHERYIYAATPPDPGAQNQWYVSLPQTMPEIGEFWQCVRDMGPSLGIGVQVTDTPEFVQCGISCQFSGCGRCSDEIGSGVIEGDLVDAVYNQPVPFARVSLFYKGVLVKQVSSDGDGHFVVTGLNERNQCGLYKLVIDKYDNNPCTDINSGGVSCGGASFPPWTYSYDVDEEARGGYWPLETASFGVENYEDIVIPGGDGRILLFPRPGAGEAYFSVLWDNKWSSGGQYGTVWGGYNNHLVLPVGYTRANSTDTQDPNYPESYYPTVCSYDNRPASLHQCSRDVTWSGELTGHPDLGRLPYAQNICLHKAGDFVDGFGPPDDVENGCPVEGRDACLQNNPGDFQKCSKGVQFSTCNGGIQNGQFCDSPGAQIECANGGGTCSEIPCQRTWWDTCSFYEDGPLTTYFRYAPYAGSVEPIHMYWGHWSKNIYSQLNNSVNVLLNHLQGNDYHAVISTDSQFVTLSADNLNSTNCGGDCKFWHLGDIDLITGSVMLENDLVSGRPDGVATYQYHFQGNYSNAYYCMQGDTLYYRCNDGGQTSNSECQASFGPGASCNIPNYVQWSRANW